MTKNIKKVVAIDSWDDPIVENIFIDNYDNYQINPGDMNTNNRYTKSDTYHGMDDIDDEDGGQNDFTVYAGDMNMIDSIKNNVKNIQKNIKNVANVLSEKINNKSKYFYFFIFFILIVEQ